MHILIDEAASRWPAFELLLSQYSFCIASFLRNFESLEAFEDLDHSSFDVASLMEKSPEATMEIPDSLKDHGLPNSISTAC